MIIYRKSKKKLIIPVGINPNINYESSGEITSQSKTVDSSTELQNVYPDPDYNYLNKVTVNPYTLTPIYVDPSTNEYTVNASDYQADGLSSVTVNPYTLESKTVDPSTGVQVVEPDEYNGLSSVTVNAVSPSIDSNIQAGNIKDGVTILGVEGTYEGDPVSVQSKSADSSTVQQTVIPDEGYNYLSSVTVNPYSVQSKTVTSRIGTGRQEITPDSGYDALSKVTVNDYEIELEDVVLDSSTEEYEVRFDPSEYDGISSIVVMPYRLQEKEADPSTFVQVITPDHGYDGISSITIDSYIPEEKTVDSSTVLQNVVPDVGYDVLTRVTVNPYVLDSKTVNSSTGQQVVTSSADGLSSVTVEPYRLQSKSVSPIRDTQTVVPDEGYDGLSSVEVDEIKLQGKIVDSSTVQQLVTFDGDNDGLLDVLIRPYVLDRSSAVIEQNGEYVFTSTADGLSRVDVSVNIPAPRLQNKSVDSSTVQQSISADAGYDALDTVTVNPYELQSKSVAPLTVPQVILPDAGYDGLSSVEIDRYYVQTKTVDSSTVRQTVTPDSGYNALGSVTVEPYSIRVQSKTVNSSTGSQTVVPDPSYDGLSSVTVNPYTISLQSKNVSSETYSQTVTPDAGYDGLSSVEIDAYVPTLDLKSVTFTQNGSMTVTPDPGYDGLGGVDISVNIPAPRLQNKSVDSSTVQQSVIATGGYDGLGIVTVHPYKVQSKTADPSTSTQVITPGSLYDALESVTINPVSLQNKTVNSSTGSQTVSADTGYTGLGNVTVSPYSLDSSSATITANGSYTFTSSADGLSRVDVSVNVSGGGIRIAEPNDVEFVGYDGKILYSYTRNEFLALTALPALVDDDPEGHLTPIGWSHPLNAAVKGLVTYHCDFLTIGQLYQTKSGAVEMWINVDRTYCEAYAVKNNLNYVPIFDSSNGLPVTVYYTCDDMTIDWGDGSAPTAGSSDGYSTHTYTTGGRHCIAFITNNGANFSISGAQETPLGARQSLESNLMVRMDACPVIASGQTITFRHTSVSGCKNNETLTLCTGLTLTSDTVMLNNAYGLKCAIIPYGINGGGTFRYTNWQHTYSLRKISIPYTGVNISSNVLTYTAVDKVYVPKTASGTTFSNLQEIQKMAFGSGSNIPTLTSLRDLREVFLSDSMDALPAISSCPALSHVWIRNALTLVPYSDIGTSSNFLTVHVPTSVLNQYKSDTDWTTWIASGKGTVVGYNTAKIGYDD